MARFWKKHLDVNGTVVARVKQDFHAGDWGSTPPLGLLLAIAFAAAGGKSVWLSLRKDCGCGAQNKVCANFLGKLLAFPPLLLFLCLVLNFYTMWAFCIFCWNQSRVTSCVMFGVMMMLVQTVKFSYIFYYTLNSPDIYGVRKDKTHCAPYCGQW